MSVTQVTPTMFADKIVAAHLFGQVQHASAASIPVDQSISVDGIVYVSHPGESWAVLTINGITEIYKHGDALPDGETLATIRPSTIQLTQAGASRQLTLNMSLYAGGSAIDEPTVDIRLAGLSSGTLPYDAQLSGILTAVAANYSTTPNVGVVNVPVTASPLEQLRALRQQLVHSP